MSHNYPYRRSAADFGSHQGAFSTSDRVHQEERDVYRSSLQPSSRPTSVFTSKSARESYPSQSSTNTESALSLLSSCGLEPSDLSILAGMPENMITEETLPRLLMEIRQKKALRDGDGPPSPRRGTCRQPLQHSSDTWENSARSSPAEYLTTPPQRQSYPPVPRPPPTRSSYPPSRMDTESWRDPEERWENSGQTGTVRQEKTSSPYVVDYNYGRPQGGDSQNLERPAYSARSVGIEERPHLPSLSDYRQLNSRKKPAAPYQKKGNLPSATTVHSTPIAREARDFHGDSPQTFPYACSLCDIAVLNQKDWTLHVSGAQHADSQLKMLQMYPDWDCRTGSARRTDSHSEKGEQVDNTGRRGHGVPQNYGVPSVERKSGPAGDQAGGKVVCVKYAANTMDEVSLRRLVGHVGTAVNVMMFPVQAFIEMSAPDEADLVVKYFNRNPVEIEGCLVKFSMSATYNFLQVQNSLVVTFSSLPPGNEKYPEILAFAKRFGTVKRSLYLPDRVLFEMGSREEARKLVKHCASHPLKMKGRIIHVSHSTEYSSLKSVDTEKDSEDEEASRRSGQSYRSRTRSSPSPRRRSPSPKKRSCSPRRRSSYTRKKSCSPRRRSPYTGKRSCSPRRRSPYTRRRSPSPRQRSPIERKRSPSPRRKSKEKQNVASKVQEKASTQSSSRHGSQSSRRSASLTREDKSKSSRHSAEKTADTQKALVIDDGVLTETPDLGSSQEPSSTPGQTKESVPSVQEHPKDDVTSEATQEQTEEDIEGENDSDMDSDIEGMAVIGEDEDMRSEIGSMESLEETEEHWSDEAGTERPSAEDLSPPSEVVEPSEEEKKVERGVELAVHLDEEPGSQSPTADSAMSKPPEVMEVQMEKQEEGQDEVEEPNEAYDEDEPDFPESLEHCITLDELEDDDDDGDDDDDDRQALTSEGRSDRRSRGEDEESGRVIYIKNLPLSYYTDKQFVAIGKKYGKVESYFLVRHRQEGFIEMRRSADARRAVWELTKKGLTMDRNILLIYLSRKYKRLTNGWKPESDEEDESEQRKHRKERRREERENDSSRTKSRKEEEPPAKKTCIREEKITPAEPTSRIEVEETAFNEKTSSNEEQRLQDEEKAATEETSSNGEQQLQEEEEKAATEETSSNGEQQLKDEEEKAATEETSSNGEQQLKDEEEKAATEETSSNGEQQLQEEEEKAVTEESSSNNKLQQHGEEKGPSETGVQEEMGEKTENEDLKISLPSESVDTPKMDTEGETSRENPDGINQVCVEEEKAEMITEPTHIPLGPYLPNCPMGREFVSQKIGYFCSLCNAIYVTEDEAKNEHCSSISHYEKLKAYLKQSGSPH